MKKARISRMLGLIRRVTINGVGRFASSLVIAQHNNGCIDRSTYSAIAAALKIGDVYCLAAGHNIGNIGELLSRFQGLSKVILADKVEFANPLAETLTPLILSTHEKLKTTHIIAGCSTFSRDLLPRVAAKLNVSPINDVCAIHDENTFQRPIYAGNALVLLKSLDPVKCLTVRQSSFVLNRDPSPNPAPVECAPEVAYVAERSEFLAIEHHKTDRPELGSAEIVISGGRGLKSAENFKLLYDLADKLGAAVGASRAAVDAGFVPNDLQVGQTGKIVAPKLYIAVGISGAIQHLAGMKDSKVIVAINKDPEAPIFQVADYGLVQDLFKAIPAMIALL